LWTVLERPDLIKRSNDERAQDHARETVSLATRWDELNTHVQASGQLLLPL
jgi:hypothetical protein